MMLMMIYGNSHGDWLLQPKQLGQNTALHCPPLTPIGANEPHQDICIMARTDARATLGLDEAIARCVAFVEAGADITFLEAPRSEEEMKRYCQEVPLLRLMTLNCHFRIKRIMSKKLHML